MVSALKKGEPWTTEMVDRLEEKMGERFELVGGVAYMMAGGTLEHGEVAARVSGGLFSQMQGSPCRVLSSDVRVAVGEDAFRYPDVSVVCGPVDPQGKVLTNPTVLVEVTSPSTREVDLGAKREEYMALPSLQAYIVVDLQERRLVMHSLTDKGWIEGFVSVGKIEVPGTPAVLDLDVIFPA